MQPLTPKVNLVNLFCGVDQHAVDASPSLDTPDHPILQRLL